MNIDVERLRRDLIDYYGTAAEYNPAAKMDVINLERVSDEIIIAIAKRKNIDLRKYSIEMEDYER